MAGEVEQAIEATFKATEKLPRSADAQYQLAAAQLLRNESRLGAVFLGRALELDPDHVRSLYALATLQGAEWESCPRPSALLRIAQTIEPNNPAIYQRWAAPILEAGFRRQAIPPPRRARRRWPSR